jgi:hypothetical protein
MTAAPDGRGGTMKRVKVKAELSDECFHAYEVEAKRQGIAVETLVERTVNVLLKEKECEEESDPIYLP